MEAYRPSVGQNVMSPLAHVAFERIGQHPYAFTRKGQVGFVYWLEFSCTYCQDVSLRQCTQPARAGDWAWRYAVDHAHGLRPQTPMAPAYGPPPTRGGWRG